MLDNLVQSSILIDYINISISNVKLIIVLVVVVVLLSIGTLRPKTLCVVFHCSGNGNEKYSLCAIMKKIAIFSTHPIQYYSPLYREIAHRGGIDLKVYYSFQINSEDQAKAGFGVGFEWDIPLLDGYEWQFLNNISEQPSSQNYHGCDTPEVSETIRNGNFDAVMVHGWYTKSYQQTMRAARKCKTPLFIRGDSTLDRQTHWLKRLVKRVTHRRLISTFDSYLVVGEKAKKYYEYYGAKPDRMIPSPHFVDNNFFEKGGKLSDRFVNFRAKFGIPDNAVVFLFCGKFIPRKRPLDFVNAIVDVSKSCKDVYGIMCGDGPLSDEVRQAIQVNQAPIYLTGFQNQSSLPSVYASSDIIVLPAEFDTWGLVINEAMACGLPGIVTNHVGCSPDLILENQTGYEYATGDVKGLSERMHRLLANRTLLANMGHNAKKHIQKYSASSAADGICEAVERFGRK